MTTDQHPDTTDFGIRVLHLLEDTGAEDSAFCALNRYLTKNDGRFFETYGLAEAAPDRISPADLIAVAMLSMRIGRHESTGLTPGRLAAIDIEHTHLQGLLRQVPVHVGLDQLSERDFERIMGPDSPLARLYARLRSIGLGPVATSKLLARKRPALVPIRDRRVSRALGDPELWWYSWWHALTVSEQVVDRITAIRSECPHPHASELTLLRVADIVLWSRSAANESGVGVTDV
jgi:hypothetical protein